MRLQGSRRQRRLKTRKHIGPGRPSNTEIEAPLEAREESKPLARPDSYDRVGVITMDVKIQWDVLATWIRAHVKEDRGASVVE